MPTEPLSASKTVEQIVAGVVSPGEVVEDSLRRIEARNADLNAFSVVLADQAREQARFLGIAAEAPGPLHGVPVAIKRSSTSPAA